MQPTKNWPLDLNISDTQEARKWPKSIKSQIKRLKITKMSQTIYQNMKSKLANLTLDMAHTKNSKFLKIKVIRT